jgi:hypothetical protein
MTSIFRKNFKNFLFDLLPRKTVNEQVCLNLEWLAHCKRKIFLDQFEFFVGGGDENREIESTLQGLVSHLIFMLLSLSSLAHASVPDYVGCRFGWL